MTTAPVITLREEVFAFECEGERLLALLHRPVEGPVASNVGVLIVVGGPQYRAGSHRQFVHLARALAAAGHSVLRFDVRGMGDSSGTLAGFEHLSADIAAAIDAFTARLPGVDRFVLWGLCDGASAALMYMDDRQDRRVSGLCLANPWVRATESHARTTLRHYYARRILQPEFWRKLLRGEVAAGAIRELGIHVRNARPQAPSGASRPFQERMLRGLERFDGQVLLLLSGEDLTCREFVDRTQAVPRWRSALGRPSITRSELPDADHTFSSRQDRVNVESMTIRWLETCRPQP